MAQVFPPSLRNPSLVFVGLGCLFVYELFIFGYGGLSLGGLVYLVVPCHQNGMISAPCSLAYDFYIVIALLGGLIGTFLVITKRIFEYYRASKV